MENPAGQLRIQCERAVYHITNRGDARQEIFLDDEDRLKFLEVLAEAVERYHWICHTYCLMPNPCHLLVETPLANLSQGMRQLNGVYTQAFNRRHNRTGHLLQGRYKAILVEKESHLLELARYPVLFMPRWDGERGGARGRLWERREGSGCPVH